MFDTDDTRDLAGVIFYVTEIVLLFLSCIVVIACFFRWVIMRDSHWSKNITMKYLLNGCTCNIDLFDEWQVMISAITLL